MYIVTFDSSDLCSKISRSGSSLIVPLKWLSIYSGMTSQVMEKRKRTTCSMSVKDSTVSTCSIDSKILAQKALRAEMLKSRFAETILKAEERLITLNEGNKGEMELLKKRKACIEAEVKLKTRQKERETARIALEKMERVVEWNDALQVQQEFEKLISAHNCSV
ncbi:Transcription factor GTE12 [Melia azedarach]|uniref:Transcription factor GTE12 n=1 Tax=Melia azedarach TaxID=155640 RepID=A0ACC1Y0S2_MELAZ|nr:Transcription factor GTE12 [Melia azedarach]